MNFNNFKNFFKRICGSRKGAFAHEIEPEVWERTYFENASEEDIFFCFRLILGRNPEEKEWYGHRLQAGKPLLEIVSKFLASNEFKENRQPLLTKSPSLSGTGHETVELYNFKLCLSSQDQVCGSALINNNEYEPSVTAVLKKVLRPGMVFLDIGANIGFFSCLAASIVGENGNVFSFEPYEYNIKMLYINKRLNDFKNIEIFPFAVSDRKDFFTYDDSAGNSGTICENDSSIPHLLSSSMLVYSVILDDALKPYADKIDVIKIDIEGAEYLALKGMKNRLKKDRPIIISEFSLAFLKAISKIPAEDYLQLLLIDKSYSFAVIAGENNVIKCEHNMEQVIDYYNQAIGDHIDIIAYPEDKFSINNSQIELIVRTDKAK